MNRLIVLPPSHFCERGRWALEAMRIPFVEERWAVGPHVGMAKKIAPRTSLPILVTPEATIQGSDAILDWTGMPGGDAETEARLSSRIAVLARQLIYSATLHDTKSGIRAVLLDGVGGPQAWLARAIWPVTRQRMAAAMQASPDRVPAIGAEIEAEFDWFEARLAGREHLVGDSFGRADLTAASLMSPFIRKRTGPGPTVRLPKNVTAMMARWRERPALRWAQGVYGRYRLSSPA